MIRDGKWYVIKNVFDQNVNLVLPATFVRRISPALADKTNSNYLGKSSFGKNMFNKQGRTYLIGLYAEQLEEAPLYHNLDQDYSPYL